MRPSSSTQPNFDFLFPRNKRFFTIRQIASTLERDPATVWRWYDTGQLYGISTTTNPEGAKAKGTETETKYKYDKRIPRESIIAFLAKSADFDYPMQYQSALDVANALDREGLMNLSKYALTRASTL